MKKPLCLKKTLYALGASLLAGLTSANADVLAGYDFNHGGGNTVVLTADIATSPLFAPTATDASVTASHVTLGAGFVSATYVAASGNFQVAEGNGMSDGVHADGGDITAFMNAAYAAGDYLVITLTADIGAQLNLADLTFDLARASRGTNDYAIRTSVDGFASYVALVDQAAGTAGTGDLTAAQLVDLSGAAFQGLSTITIHIVADDRQNNNGSGSATLWDDIVVNGTVAASTTPTWAVDGNGDWSTALNWDPSVPNAASDIAIFDSALPLTGPLTANLDVAVTIGTLSFSSSEAITISGANALTFDGGGAASVSATAGSHAISAAVSLTDPLDLALSSGSALDISGALSGTTSVTNSGDGSLTLSGDLSVHTGSIISDAGTLVVSGSDSSDITSNAGALVVSGTNSGTITANAGSVEVSGTGSSSDITIATGVTLSGEGSHTGTLNLATGSILSVDPSNGTTAFTTGTLSPTAPVNVGFSSSPLGLGAFTVLNYTTYAGTVATDFVNTDLRITFADTSTSITATVGAAETSNWTGAVNDGGFFYWDNGTSANWSSADSLFFAEDSVTFTDIGVGFVDVAAEVAPSTVTFTNTIGNNYPVEDATANVETISATTGGINVTGNGDVALNVKITGNTSITHSGAGTLSLGGGAVNNDFVGTITVDGGGTLKNLRNQDNITSLGNSGNTFSFTNGSTFDLNSISTHDDYQAYGTGSFVFGDGTTLTNTSASTSNDAFGDQLVFDGDVTLEGVGRFDIQGDIGVTGTDIVITAENDSGSVLGTSNTGKSIAEWVVNDGILFASVGTAFGDAVITVNADGAITGNTGIATDNGNGLGVTNIANAITLNGGALLANQNAATTSEYSGTVTVTADSQIDPNLAARTVILSGFLTESGSGGNLSIGDGTTVIASTLDATGFTGDFFLNEAGTFDLENSVNLTQGIVVNESAGNKAIVLSLGNSAEISGGITINESTATEFDLSVVDAADTLTVSGIISGSGAAGVTKTSAGSLILSGVNTYTGNTKIWNGIVTLVDDAQLTFVPTTNGVNNTVNGAAGAAGTLNLDGDIYLDLSGADTTDLNSWLLIDDSILAAVVYGGTFSVNSSVGVFAETVLDNGIWQKVDGDNTWTFDEASGTLTVASASAFSAWATSTGATNDPDAHDDGDVLNNLLEFAFGTDPLIVDGVPLDVSGPTAGIPTTEITYGPLEYNAQYVQRTDGSVTYTVQFSNDLAIWEDNVAVPALVAAIDADYEIVEVPYPIILSNGKKAQFFRVVVELN